MREFDKLKNYAEKNGWSITHCSGDHYKFYPPSDLNKKGFVTVNESLSSNNRSFNNMIGQFRKFDKNFMRQEQHIKKQEKETPEPITEQPVNETTVINTNMKPEDKTIYKQYSWLQKGTKVRIRNNESQTTPAIVTEIHSADKKRVWDTTDIIVLKINNTTTDEMAGDLDAWETRKCMECGQDKPLNHFKTTSKTLTKQYTCNECLNKNNEANKTKIRNINKILDDLHHIASIDKEKEEELLQELMALIINDDETKKNITKDQIKEIFWYLLGDNDRNKIINALILSEPKKVLEQIDTAIIADYFIQNCYTNKEFIDKSKMLIKECIKSMTNNPMEQHELLTYVSNDVLLESIKLRKLNVPNELLTNQQIQYEMESRGLNKPDVKKITTEQLTDEILCRNLSFPRLVCLMSDSDILNETHKRNLTIKREIDSISDKELYDTLKARGWNLGKIERTVIETLE